MLHFDFENANRLERVICMKDYDRKKQAIKNAEASLRMEGLRGSEEMREAVYKVLEGRMAEETYLTEVFQRAMRKRS